MSDAADWGDIESLPKPKDGIPKWIWCCGCGCLIPILLILAMGGYGYNFVQDGRNPEKARAHLALALPSDGEVVGWNLEFGRPGWFGWEFYLWVQEVELDEDGKPTEPILFALLMIAPPEAIDDLLATGQGTEEAEVEPFEITIQGRELTGTRSSTEGAEAPFPFMPDPEDGASVVLDLSEEEATQARALLIVRQGSSDPITDEEIGDFLAPFHVGPDR